jgi:hypothetical protein
MTGEPERPPVSPIGMTVHTLAAPDLSAAGGDRRRTAVGRWKMLAVLAVCAAPVVASYFTYFVVRPEARTNYSTLITPPRPLPEALPLTDPAGQSVLPRSLRGQWLVVVVAAAACDARCEKNLVLVRQLRETLGRDKDRVDKLWLVSDGAVPAEAARQAAGVTALRVPREALAAWLAPAAGQALEDHVYLVDPMGQWMMRAPVDPEPPRLKRDLERLLRASASWDQAGR